MPARQRKTVAKGDKIQPDRFERATNKANEKKKADEKKATAKLKAAREKEAAKVKAAKAKEAEKKKAAKDKVVAAKAAADVETRDAQVAVLKTLKPIAKEIDTRLTKASKLQGDADDHRLAAALRLAEAKDEVESVGLKFSDWAEAHIADQSWQTIRKLAAVGASDNPAEALAEMREKNKAANKKLRDQSSPAKGSTAPALTAVDTALNAIDKMDEGTRKRLIQSVAGNEGLKVVEAGADAAETVVVGSVDTAKAAFLALPRKDRADFVAWAKDRINLEDEDDGDIPAFLDRRPAGPDGKRKRKTTKK